MRTHPTIRYAGKLLSLLLVFGLTTVGCDSGGASDSSSMTRIEGRVTNNDTAGKWYAGDVDEADVRPREVNDSNGSTSEADGSDRTDANGRFSLETSASADLVMLTATKAGFSSRVLVDMEAKSSGRVAAMTMTSETASEADVYIAARSAGHDRVSTADVAVYVDADVSGEITAGTVTAARVAAAIGAAENAEAEYQEAEGQGAMGSESENRERSAYRAFQIQVTSGASFDAAVKALEKSTTEADVEAGVSVTAHARARQTAAEAMAKFSAGLSTTARTAIRKRAQVMASLATSAAIETEFRNNNASQARIDAAATAGAQLTASIRSAGSESEINEAWTSFSGSIEALVAAELGVSAQTISVASASLSGATLALRTALDLATSVNAVVSAKAEYYQSAEASYRSALSTSAKAELGARVLSLVSAS